MNELDAEEEIISSGIPDLGMDRALLSRENLGVNLAEWKSKPTGDVKVSLDAARRHAWTQAKKEIKFIRGKVMAATSKQNVTVFDLLDLIFGEKSEIWMAFSREINIPHETFLRFLGVYLIGCSHNKAPSQLYGEYSFLKSHVDFLLPKDVYFNIWDRISKASLPVSMGQVAFWLTIQNAFNAFCRKHFIVGSDRYDMPLQMVLDDDKVHYSTTKTDTDGLKVVRHVNDNINGHVLHTACLSHIGLIIGVEAERSEDDSVGSASKRLLINQLRPTHGTNGPPDFKNIDIHADRAYWGPEMSGWILQSGADISASTRKRSYDFPFTFEQKLRENDCREDIPTTGFKNLFIKSKSHEGRDIAAVAYRNNGNVTLGLSTKFSGHEWDLVLRNPNDFEAIHDPDWALNIILSTALVNDPDSVALMVDLKQLISSRPVLNVTTDQNTPGWFLMRSFSITSSTADLMLRQLYIEYNSRKLRSTMIDSSFTVFNFVYHNVLVFSDADDESRSSESAESSSDENSESSEEEIPPSFNFDNIDFNISSWNANGSIEDMVDALGDPNFVTQKFNSGVLKSYADRMGITSKTKATMTKDIKSWLEVSTAKRPLLFLQKTALAEMVAQKEGRELSVCAKMNREQLIDRIIGKPADLANHSNEENHKELWQRLLGCVLKSTFMHKLTGKGKQYANIGHRNEEPLLRALLNRDDNPHKLLQILRPGLVSKGDNPYAKTSVDAIGLIKYDNELELVGIELKSRVTNQTREREIAARNEHSDDETFVEIHNR